MKLGKRMMSLRRRLGLLAFLTLFVLLAAAPCLAQRRMVVGQDDSMPASAELKAAAVDWASVGLDAKLNPVEVDVTTLESYAGDYGPRHLRVEEGRLVYQRDDRDPFVATPMIEALFGFDTLPYFRLEVVLGADGVPVKLIGHYDNGRTDENPRDQ